MDLDLQSRAFRKMANVNAVVLKIIMAGESFVGKTSILKRYSDSKFDSTFLTTVGIDFKVKTIIIDEKTVKLQIWDTAGQERFHTLTTNYFRGAHGIVLVYDITNSRSFKNVVTWIRDIDTNASEDVDKILLGNKCDMEEKRVVKKESGEKLGWEYGMRFFETSAKDNINIDSAFVALAKDIMSKKSSFLQEIEVIDESPAEKKKCCNI